MHAHPSRLYIIAITGDPWAALAVDPKSGVCGVMMGAFGVAATLRVASWVRAAAPMHEHAPHTAGEPDA